MPERELTIIRNCPKCNAMRRLVNRGKDKIHVCATCETPLAVVQGATVRLAVPFAFGKSAKITLVNMSPQSGEPPDESDR